MGAPVNLIGMRFGRVSVVGEAESRYTPSGYKTRMWNCICDCGNEFTTSTGNLRSGDTKSCGCYAIESRKRNATTHGDAGTKLHNIWSAMRRRCRDENSHDYKYYGGKGVHVCDDWDDDYLSFKEWATQNGYCDGLTIDRIDSDGDYCPDNCRWVSMKAQCNNRTNSRKYTYNNESHTIAEWAEIYNIKYSTLYMRLRKNDDIGHALNNSNI